MTSLTNQINYCPMLLASLEMIAMDKSVNSHFCAAHNRAELPRSLGLFCPLACGCLESARETVLRSRLTNFLDGHQLLRSLDPTDSSRQLGA
jgi:hypothetical protein